MTLLALLLPLLAAALSALLGRFAPARVLVLIGAAAFAVSGALLILGDGVALAPRTWLAVGTLDVRVALAADPVWLPLLVTVCWCAALSLLDLAQALGRDVRGLGGTVALLTLAPALLLLGTCLSSLLHVTTWTLLALVSFAVSRSAATHTADRLPTSLLAGLAGPVLLVIGSLWAGGAPILFVLLAAWLVIGLPPFADVTDDLTAAPAGFAALLVPLGLPALGGVTLLRWLADHPAAVERWRPWLIGVAVLAMVGCAAAALRATTLRQIAARQLAAGVALALLAAASGLASGVTLLSTALVSAAILCVAASVAERRAGSDAPAAIVSADRPLVGAAVVLAGLAALGVPGTWGFWSALALARGLGGLPWAAAALVLGLALLALSYVAPVTALLRGAPGVRTDWRDSAALVLAVPLLAGGALPQLSGAATDTLGAIVGISGAALALAVPLLLAWLPARRVLRDPEVPASAAPPLSALAETVAPLALLAAPQVLFTLIWEGLVSGGGRLGELLRPLARRYYLAWLLLGLVLVIFVLL